MGSMSLTDMWRNMRDKLAQQQKQKPVPANEVIPRMRESSGPFPVLKDAPPSLGEATPFASEIQAEAEAAAIPPPPWSEVFPAHHKALLADLIKRGEKPERWEVQDGRDLGVSENGHTVAFTLSKIGTPITIQAELTLFKGQLASVRVR